MGDMPDNPGRPRCAHVRHARQPRPTPLRPCPTCPTSSPATLQPCPICPTSSPATLQPCPTCPQARRPRCRHVGEDRHTPPSRPPSCANPGQQFNIIPIGYAQAPVPEVVPARRCPTTPRRATWRLQVLEISHEGSPFSAHGSGTRAANRSREPPRAGGSSLRLLRDAGEVCPRSRHGSDRPCVV